MQKINFLSDDLQIIYSGNFINKLKKKWLAHAPHLWWGDRLDSRFLVVRLLNNIRNKKILDLGCNAGIVLTEMDSSNFSVGLDLSKHALKIAKTISINSKLLCGNMLDLPFKDNSFDTVIFLGMLEVPDKERKKNAINEIHRVLKVGGRLFLTTPNRAYIRSRLNSNYVNYSELESLLDGQFIFQIKGFNPFPQFPYFIPNRILAKIPLIWEFLVLLMDKDIFKRTSCSFFACAEKIVYTRKNNLK